MAYWLFKSEPSEVSIDSFDNQPIIPWFGIRNYQARNFMRDDMKIGDQGFFYHSSCAIPGIAGIVEVCSAPYPDFTQFDVDSPYYDPRSNRESPRWVHIDVKRLQKTPFLPLTQIRTFPELADMRLLQRGNRLSITPVTETEWKAILKRLNTP